MARGRFRALRLRAKSSSYSKSPRVLARSSSRSVPIEGTHHVPAGRTEEEEGFDAVRVRRHGCCGPIPYPRPWKVQNFEISIFESKVCWWARERREEAESLAELGRPVRRVGLRKPRLAMVFGDLSPDAMQLQMVSVASVLEAMAYEMKDNAQQFEHENIVQYYGTDKGVVRVSLDLNENPSATIVLPPEVRTSDNSNPCFAEVLQRNSAIKARPTHRQLKKDLIEHIWQRYGNKEN